MTLQKDGKPTPFLDGTVPVDYEFTKVNLKTGLNLWLIGLPDYCTSNSDGEIRKCPIQPFWWIRTIRLPKKNKK